MQSSVALILVSHDGARWLPTVIDGIRGQAASIAGVVPVDTGSKDGSADLLEQAFGGVVRTSGRTSFPEAIDLALRQIPGEAEGGPGWIWILHDDSTPDPGALAALLDAAEKHPEADVLGPKLREWPSLRHLLEMGVTISGTGRRETGLERDEQDQGQHDEVRRVLAVNTAGMLVRRRLLEKLGGFDKQLPMFGNDIDFGWRAATAGHTTIVVPEAIVFHAEAAHRGVRRTPLTGRHTHYQERRSALYTLLVNSKRGALPFQLVRLAFGTLLRMVGFLVVREVGTALDELAALVNVYSRLGGVLAGRRSRQAGASADPVHVRALLPAAWLPYRHGLDFVGDLASALTNQAADVAERRRMAKAEADPASFAARRQAELEQQDEDDIPVENGWVVRFLTNPVAVLVTLVGVLGVIGARAALGSVAGGGLAPVPDGARALWEIHLESWHAIGQGSAIPAPPYVLPLALLATVLGGHPGLAVSLVMLLSFPLALGGAWRLLRVTGRLVSHRGAPRWLILWGATAYALVPFVSGAWGAGRLGPVVAGALLPWVAHAGLGFADPEADRRWRAGWRTGLLLTLTVAFAPSGWLVAALLTVVVLVVAFRIVPGAATGADVWGPPATALLVPPVLLLPWWLPAVLHGGWAGLLLDPGRLAAPTADGGDLLLGRLSEGGTLLGAPWWLGLAIPLLALLALLPGRTRIPVLVCWIVAVVVAAVGMVLSWLPLHLAAGTTTPGPAFTLVALQGAAVVAAVLGIQGALLDGLANWRRILAVVAAGIGVVGATGGLAWFVVAGNDQLTDQGARLAHAGVPAYMLDASTDSKKDGVLVIRGSVDDGLRYAVLRGDGLTLGKNEVAATTPEDRAFTALVGRLAAAPDQDVINAVARQGITYVVMPGPADHAVAEGIDASGGVSQASTADDDTRAWQVDPSPGDPGLSGHRSWLRIALLVVQFVGMVAVLVLCLPTVQNRRRAR